MQALAVNDFDAAPLALLRGDQKTLRRAVGLVASQSVHVQGRLNRELPPAQLAQDGPRQAAATKFLLIAGIEIFRIKLPEHGFLHDLGVLALAPFVLPLGQVGRQWERRALACIQRFDPRQFGAPRRQLIAVIIVLAKSVVRHHPAFLPRRVGRGCVQLIIFAPLMRILLSNDDGIHAPGLRALARALESLGQLTVVAPDRNRSGASNSLTLGRPLRINEMQPGWYSVDGTPTDCVHLAITGLLDHRPDIVVSGINAGANLGDDTLYSGTVAAAMEGRFMGLPAIAVSNVGYQPQHYDAAAQVVVRLLQDLPSHPLPPSSILNINVPDVPYEQLQGIEVTRLGYRHIAEDVVRDKDPRGRPIYWIGPAGGEEDAGPGTDFHAINQNKVALTPLQIDLTNHSALDGLKGWVPDL